MGERRGDSREVRRVGREALRMMRAQDHVPKASVARRARVALPTAKRALEWLRDQGAPVEYSAKCRGWSLRDKNFALPLLDPTLEDLQAALAAAGLLSALGQTSASSRAWALFDELDIRIHGGRGRSIRRDALRVTQSVAILSNPTWFLGLLRSVRRDVLRIDYLSPWVDEPTQHVYEPWQLWLRDGRLYVHGWSRTRGARRTLRLASIRDLVKLDEKPRQPVPSHDSFWPEHDNSFGIDEDRPEVGVITFRGSIARWVAGEVWHANQTDKWSEAHECLERRVPYRSCREFARRLVGVADGIDSVSPDELRIEVARLGDCAASLKAK